MFTHWLSSTDFQEMNFSVKDMKGEEFLLILLFCFCLMWTQLTCSCLGEVIIQHQFKPITSNLRTPQFSLVAQSCLTLCDPVDCSTPGFPVHHQLPELAQTHVHRVGDVIQPSHPLQDT